jgi:hypothetical protein
MKMENLKKNKPLDPKQKATRKPRDLSPNKDVKGQMNKHLSNPLP